MHRPPFLLLVLLPLFLSISGAQDGGAGSCPHLRYGYPQFPEDIRLTLVCKKGYVSLIDDDHLVPRFVEYHLTAVHTLGCERRSNKFHAEETLPAIRRATPRDYIGSGYDRGHHAPAADFAWSKALSLETFSMANMAPQIHGLNAGEWEHLEETIRVWAFERGNLEVMVGSILPPKPKSIGVNEIGVPTWFWKVIVNGEEAIAFMMPNRTITKGDLSPYQAEISDIERTAEIDLPVKKKGGKPPIWSGDAAAWRDAHQHACSH